MLFCTVWGRVVSVCFLLNTKNTRVHSGADQVHIFRVLLSGQTTAWQLIESSPDLVCFKVILTNQKRFC